MILKFGKMVRVSNPFVKKLSSNISNPERSAMKIAWIGLRSTQNVKTVLDKKYLQNYRIFYFTFSSWKWKTLYIWTISCIFLWIVRYNLQYMACELCNLSPTYLWFGADDVRETGQMVFSIFRRFLSQFLIVKS